MRFTVLAFSIVAAAVQVHGQGTVIFQNLLSRAVITNSLTDEAVVVGPSFKAALYYAPDSGSVPADSAFSPLGAAVDFGPVAGHFQGGLRTTPGTTAPGGSAYFQVRVWEAAYGATYEAAIAAPAMNGRLALRALSARLRVPATGNLSVFPPALPPPLTWHGLQSFGLTYPGMP